jgi:hypothetical protein
VLDDLGLGSVPRHRLLEEALVSIVQAVPGLRTRLFGQVFLSIAQAGDLLRTTPAVVKQLVKPAVLPGDASGKGPPARPLITAVELLKYRSHIQQSLAQCGRRGGRACHQDAL